MTAFDPIQTADELREAGMSEATAKRVVRAIQQAQESGRGDIVTKAELKAELADLKADMARWLFAALAAHFGLTLATMYVFVRAFSGGSL